MSTATTSAVRASKARAERRRRRLLGYGQWDPWRPAEPVRAYVRELMAADLPMHRIAEKADVPKAVLRHLMYGTGDFPPAKKIRTENAEKIMAYRPSLDDYPPLTVISSVGSRRRLQALATLGWTLRALAAHSATPYARFKHVMQAPTTSVTTALIIRDLYDELWSRNPTEEEVSAWVAKRTRDNAARHNWSGPLAWEDDRIDDPKARPRRGKAEDKGAVDMAAVMRRLEGEQLELTAWEHTAAIDYGMRIRGLTFDAVAELLGMELDSVKRSWERIKERARANGETWPDQPRWTDPLYTIPTTSRAVA